MEKIAKTGKSRMENNTISNSRNSVIQKVDNQKRNASQKKLLMKKESKRNFKRQAFTTSDP